MVERQEEKADHDLLFDRFESIRRTGLALLDGGFATHLEDGLGQDISSSSLWSASLLDSREGSKAVIQTHVDFLRAGANVVSTSSYQASTLAFHLAGQSADKAKELLIKSVQLAQQAREDFCSQSTNSNLEKPLLLLSLGPFGAALSNGAEYTGNYFIPDSNLDNKAGKAVTLQDLEDFHFTRLETLATSSEWTNIDLIAFETIPRLDEAIAIRKALDRIFATFPRKLSYASFVFPQGSHLPWPIPRDAAYIENMDTLVQQVVGVDEAGQVSPLMGIGINCTKPKFLSNLVKRLTVALTQAKTRHKPYLFVSAKKKILLAEGGKEVDLLR